MSGGKWTVGTASGRNAGMIFDEHGEAVAAVYGLPVNWSVSECKSDAESADALRRAYKLAAAPETAEALKGATAALVAAISLLERGGKAAKKAAPSDTMFDMMLDDYRKAIVTARAALALAEGE